VYGSDDPIPDMVTRVAQKQGLQEKVVPKTVTPNTARFSGKGSNARPTRLELALLPVQNRTGVYYVHITETDWQHGEQGKSVVRALLLELSGRYPEVEFSVRDLSHMR
jgi:hypothetical protein